MHGETLKFFLQLFKNMIVIFVWSEASHT